MKIGAIIQARTGSSRLPKKVLMDLCGETVLWHVVQRVSQSKKINQIIIATTDKEEDAKIVDEAKRIGVDFFRGSEEDVLSRYYFAAKENEIDLVVRITSDCPLIDPHVVDEIIGKVESGVYLVATNGGNDLSKRRYPRGLDVEAFTFDLLERAYFNAKEKYQREHVTPYLYENETSVFYDTDHEDLSSHRWTLDTKEDYKLISIVYNSLYKGKHSFYLDEIISFIQKHPEIAEINKDIKQKKLGE